jgi:preprotein translocase subunit SecB
MKAEASPLHIIDFAVTQLDFNLVVSPNLDEDLRRYFKQYAVDVDFGLSKDEFLRVFIKAEVNYSENKLPGYSLAAEAACIFEFDKGSNLPAAIKNNLEGFSTVYIALNSLRGLISNFTANAPFGRYILPSIDLNDLIEKKKQQLLSEDKRPKRTLVAKNKAKKRQVKTK